MARVIPAAIETAIGIEHDLPPGNGLFRAFGDVSLGALRLYGLYTNSVASAIGKLAWRQITAKMETFPQVGVESR